MPSSNSVSSLTGSTTIFVSWYEDDAVLHAASVLAKDFGKVFGSDAHVVHDRAELPADAAVVVVASRPEVLADWGAVSPVGPETFRLELIDGVVVLAGADNRGAIFGAYHFAEHVLGIDPLYYWTDQVVEPRDSISLSVDWAMRGSPATFRFRGWFMNDEDLLVGWGRDREGQSAIDLQVWDVIYETILRCKGNMVIPGTFVFSDEPAVRLAGRRGLIMSQHHCEILGTNTFRWPQDEEFSFVRNRRAVEAAWQNAVVTYGDQEMIWTVGYRGLTDRAFWFDDPGVAETDAERGKVISDAIARQVEIVKKFRKDPVIIWNAWDEGVALWEAGHLTLPEGITVVWPDRRGGLMRDKGRVKPGQGAYVHPAFFNDTANHLSEAVPVDRFARELTRYAEVGATEYLLLNVSCIRPTLLTTKAVMDMGWKMDGWQDEPVAHSQRFYEEWNEAQFGAETTAQLKGYWENLFNAPAAFDEDECDVVADQVYHTVTAAICRRALQDELEKQPLWWPLSLFPHEEMGPKLAFIAQITADALPRWEALHQQATSAQSLVPSARRDFYTGHVLAPLAVGRQGNRMLHAVARAAQAILTGDYEKALAMVGEALQAAEETRVALKRAEYGKWRDFYEYSWFTNYPRSIAILRALQAQLKGEWAGDAVFLHHRTYTVSEALSYYQKGRFVQTEPLNEFGEGIDNYHRWQL